MKKRKAGVAVIVVLGVLGLLMVLAVAFSVTMRVERAGAANYASDASSRQLVWAALARAVADINAATPGFYPDGDFLVSRNAAPVWDTNGVGGIRLAVGRVRDHVPGVLLPLASSAVSEWQRQRTAEGMGGHVAYLALNVSDLLDLNEVGAVTREGGTNAAELVLSGLAPPVDTNELRVARLLHRHFESLAEFRALTNLPTEVFVDYSRYPPDNNRTNALYIGGTANDLQTNQIAILQRLNATLPLTERPNLAAAGQMVTNLLDYIDANSVPRLLDGPNPEAVPMLNEVAYTNNMAVNRLGGRIDVETWFPFLATNRFNHQFQVRYAYTVVVTVQAANVTNTTTYASPGIGPVFRPAPLSFSSAPSVFQFEIAPALNTYSNPTVTIDVSVSNMMVVLSGTSTQVDSATNVTLRFGYSGPYVPSPPMTPVSFQVTDPRLNWRQTDWVATNAPTIGTTNLTTVAYWQDYPYLAGEYPLYVSDLGWLYSPLELGNLLIPGPDSNRELAPWRTFRVFAQGAWPRHRLLENFTIDEDIMQPKRGLVNANTLDPALVATAFREMPHPYHAPGGATLTNTIADAVAAHITAARTVPTPTVFTNITSLLDLDWRGAPGLANRPDVEMEALAAYSTGLLGVRQNLFLIVASGSAAEEGLGERARYTVRTQSRRTAVVLLWRDPEARILNPGTQEETRWHPCFVRYFKWIDD